VLEPADALALVDALLEVELLGEPDRLAESLMDALRELLGELDMLAEGDKLGELLTEIEGLLDIPVEVLLERLAEALEDTLAEGDADDKSASMS